MSEFSCSYHLKSENINDCINLVKRAKISGFIFPPKNGWVSFVVDEPDFKFSGKLIETNEGVLLNYINAEDHGWSFDIFDKNNRVCKFECNYNNGKEYSNEKYIENWDFIFDNNQSKVLNKIFSINKKEPLKNDPNKFAVSMGLHFYEWVSYEYICNDPASFSEYKIIKIKGKKKKEIKKITVFKVPILQWTGGRSPLPINGKVQYEHNAKEQSRKILLPINEIFYTSLEFVNIGKACKGITVIIVGKSIEDENIELEKMQLFDGLGLKENEVITEEKFIKVIFQDGRKGYYVKVDTVEIAHSISYSESLKIFMKTQSRDKKFHQYTIKIYAKAVNKPDKIEAIVFIHPNENYNEGYFYQDLFGDRDRIVFK